MLVPIAEVAVTPGRYARAWRGPSQCSGSDTVPSRSYLPASRLWRLLVSTPRFAFSWVGCRGSARHEAEAKRLCPRPAWLECDEKQCVSTTRFARAHADSRFPGRSHCGTRSQSRTAGSSGRELRTRQECPKASTAPHPERLRRYHAPTIGRLDGLSAALRALLPERAGRVRRRGDGLGTAAVLRADPIPTSHQDGRTFRSSADETDGVDRQSISSHSKARRRRIRGSPAGSGHPPPSQGNRAQDPSPRSGHR